MAKKSKKGGRKKVDASKEAKWKSVSKYSNVKMERPKYVAGSYTGRKLYVKPAGVAGREAEPPGMAGKQVQSRGVMGYADIVRLPLLFTFLWLVLTTVLPTYYPVEFGLEGQYRQLMVNSILAVWILVPIFIGVRMARSPGATPLHAGIVGAVFGFLAEGLYYLFMLIGLYAGLFGAPMDFAGFDWAGLGDEFSRTAGLAIVKSAALAALGMLVMIFVVKMREAD